MSIQDSAATETGDVFTAVTLQSLSARSNTPTSLLPIALSTLLGVLALLGLGVWRQRQAANFPLISGELTSRTILMGRLVQSFDCAQNKSWRLNQSCRGGGDGRYV